MADNFDDVRAFNQKFGFPHSESGRTPDFLTPEESAFRIKFIEEEVAEYKEAIANGDLPGAADALVDLVYVALGTAHWHGFQWAPLWNEVHRANMDKIRVANASESKRDTKFDCRKPPGWRPPNIAAVLRRFWWKCDGNHAGPSCGEGCWNGL